MRKAEVFPRGKAKGLSTDPSTCRMQRQPGAGMNRSNIEYLAAITQIQPSRLSLTRFLPACLVAVVASIMGTMATAFRRIRFNLWPGGEPIRLPPPRSDFAGNSVTATATSTVPHQGKWVVSKNLGAAIQAHRVWLFYKKARRRCVP